MKQPTKASNVWLTRALVAILLVLPLIYFAPLLSGKKMMYGSDWLLSGYAFRQWIADSVANYGSAPYWNPYVFSGLPVRNPFTLFTLLYTIIPVHLVWTYLFVAAAFLAGLGMYLYLKELKLPLHASFLGGIAYMGSNGYIKTSVRVAESKRYATELVASGDASEGICPRVEVHLDGQKVAEVQLTTEGWRAYPLSLALEEGQHELALYFVNDHYAPTGDRNLRLDKMVFYGD